VTEYRPSRTRQGPERPKAAAAPAQSPDLIRQSDANRTDFLTGSALGAKIADIRQRGQVWGQQDADGPGIDPPVKVGRAHLKNRTDIEAGPAAEAVQGLGQLRVRGQAAPPVVQDHQVKDLLPLGLDLESLDKVNQGREALTGGAGGQQPQHDLQVG
jgi:hypothetical protein